MTAFGGDRMVKTIQFESRNQRTSKIGEFGKVNENTDLRGIQTVKARIDQ